MAELKHTFTSGVMNKDFDERLIRNGEYRDALVSKNHRKLNELTEKDTIATSSLRRKAQLLQINPRFNIIDIRGNVDTRLEKLDNGAYDAIVLAACGLERLNLDSRISEHLNPNSVIPAAGQGIVCAQIRENDTKLLARTLPNIGK